MSFLTSFFALNVDTFPHSDDGLAYSPGWIYPRICKCQHVQDPIYDQLGLDTNSVSWVDTRNSSPVDLVCILLPTAARKFQSPDQKVLFRSEECFQISAEDYK